MPYEAEVAMAEDLLVLSMFKEAAESSKSLLDRLIYSTAKEADELRKRAAFVWLQAEFAAGALQHSWAYLQQAFQNDIGLDLATVWYSLKKAKSAVMILAEHDAAGSLQGSAHGRGGLPC